MKINLVATRDRFKVTGRKFAPWAMSKGINPGTFKQFTNGLFVADSLSGEYGKIIACLREDGLLVEEEEKQAA